MRFASQLSKAEFVTFVLTAISALFSFIAALTPSWQVAEDIDAHRSVKSGLWIYCTEGTQCWYIFSDTLINYYERVDVCRFLLIYDCRKKLLRTPYFFGWHCAVLILMVFTLIFMMASMAAIGIGHFRRRYARIAIVMLDISISLAFLLLCIALAVFMINAEMLESRYLIGIKNTFEKSYGISFYMACIGLTILMFALMGAVFLTTSAFFMNGLERDYLATHGMNGDTAAPDMISDSDYGRFGYEGVDADGRKYRMMQEALPQSIIAETPSLDTSVPGPRYCYSPDMAIPTRTFLSY